MDELEERIKKHWTAEKLKHLTQGKPYPLLPTNAAKLFRALGILHADGSFSRDAMRKFVQINHFMMLMEPEMKELVTRYGRLDMLDAACGKSYLGLGLAWLWGKIRGVPYALTCVDHNPKVMATVRRLTEELDMAEHTVCDTRPLAACPEAELPKWKVVLALHACDTATDEALNLGLRARAEVIAVAPCCQAEMARSWRGQEIKEHPLAPLMENPYFRRELGSLLTDGARMLLMRSRGYEVTVTEFVAAEHSPKNALLLCKRRGRYWAPAQKEWETLQQFLGGAPVALAQMLEASAPEACE